MILQNVSVTLINKIMQKNCPTQQQVKDTLTNFAQNFQSDGFIVFGGKTQVNFIGRILVNYKGLRVLKFRKSQLHKNQFNEHQFSKLCQPLSHLVKQQQLLQNLQSKYPTSSFCIIAGGVHQSTGHLAVAAKGHTSVYIY